MAKSIKDRLLTLGAAAVVGLGAIPLSNLAVAADTVTFDGTTITIPSEGASYLNITADGLKEVNPDTGGKQWLKHIFYENVNFSESDHEYKGNQALYINVDAAGYDEIFLPGAQIKGRNFGEENAWYGSNILWNIVDSSAPDGLFHGTVRNLDGIHGGILAPEANIVVSFNVEGNLIGKNVTYTGGAELHKSDFLTHQIEKIDTEKIDVSKEWTNVMPGQPDSVTVNLYRSRNGNLTPKYCEENAVDYTGTLTSSSTPVWPGIPGMPGSSSGTSQTKFGDDNLPYTQGRYQDSHWYTGGPLGVAGDFTVFAFDTVTHEQHMNGNIACKKLVMNSALPLGPNVGNPNIISVVTESLEINNRTDSLPYDCIDYKMNNLVLPAQYNAATWGEVWEDGRPQRVNTMAYPYKGDKYLIELFNGSVGEVGSQSDLKIAMNMSNKELYLMHADEGYLDFDALQKEYDELSYKIANEQYNPVTRENDDLNAVEFVGQTELKASGDWKASFENLPKTDSNGNPWYYYIKEDTSALFMYTDSYEGNPVSNGDGSVKVKNGMRDTKSTNADFSKTDALGNELAGATLTLTGVKTNGETISLSPLGPIGIGMSRSVLELGEGATGLKTSGSEIKWISGTTPTKVKYLVDGIYTLHEEAAPNGYNIATDIRFEIRDQKIVKIGEADVTADTDTIIMEDYLLKDVVISKQTVASEELKGAELTLTGRDAQTNKSIDLSKVTLELGEEAKAGESSASAVKWTSGSAPTTVKGLPDGIYTLHEDTAPLGYHTATDIEFTIEKGKLVKIGSADADDAAPVVMTDKELATVEISKTGVDGKELEGATLILTGIDKQNSAVTFAADQIEAGTDAVVQSADGDSMVQWISDHDQAYSGRHLQPA